MASPRVGVTARSSPTSSGPMYSRKGCPSGASAGNSRMPSDVSARPSSSAEHSMPADSTPRSLAALMFSPPGSSAPTVASAVFKPTRALAAPQTICKAPSPLRLAASNATRQTCNLSACGWRVASMISATITPENTGAAGVMLSSSKPAMVSRSPSSRGARSCDTHSRSASREIFMPHRTGAGSANHSRRTAANH